MERVKNQGELSLTEFPPKGYNRGCMGRLCLKIFFATIFSALITGCELLSSMDQKGDVNSFDPSKVAFWSDGDARIKPGVLLNIQVGAAGIKPVDMAVQVDAKGAVTLQYLLSEPVECDGLTLDAFQKKLLATYQRYIKQPQVTVSFGPYDPRTGVSPYGFVTVLGEVHNPGPVNMPPTMDLTVTKALQLAGNTKPFANKRNVLVTRCAKNGSLTQTQVDIVEIGERGRIDKDMVLRPGDVVYVRETYL